jgi:hypothetical protein
VVDVRTNQVVLRVRSGATGIWHMEFLFDRTGSPYLANGIVAGNLLVFNFDVDHQITVTVFDEDMCHQQYVPPARGKPAVSSSNNDDEEDQ